jgi:hypothetical protein
MKISGSKIKQVDRFTYLESMVEKWRYRMKLMKEKNGHTILPILIKGILWNKDTDRKCKHTKHKMHFKKIQLYVAETWARTKSEESKIQATDMKFLRSIMGNNKMDSIKNAHITEDLRMEDIQYQIEGNR